MAAALACRLRWMSGRATLTTKKSRMNTKVPVRMTASGTHLAMRETESASVSRCWLVMVIAAATEVPPALARGLIPGRPGDVLQLGVVPFPPGGVGFWGRVAGPLAHADRAIDGFPDDVRLPGVPGRLLDHVHEQGG